jgi:hypothetical protein
MQQAKLSFPVQCPIFACTEITRQKLERRRGSLLVLSFRRKAGPSQSYCCSYSLQRATICSHYEGPGRLSRLIESSSRPVRFVRQSNEAGDRVLIYSTSQRGRGRALNLGKIESTCTAISCLLLRVPFRLNLILESLDKVRAAKEHTCTVKS